MSTATTFPAQNHSIRTRVTAIKLLCLQQGVTSVFFTGIPLFSATERLTTSLENPMIATH